MSPQNKTLSRLTASQARAWQHVFETANSYQASARSHALRLLPETDCPQSLYYTALDVISKHARVVLHFHPDRIGAKRETVAEGLLKEGKYRNQFETGLSNGSTTAFAGGPRDEWERQLFGGAYHLQDTTFNERPKYGALELFRYSDGPWPRFGSCYFVLQPEVTQRTSFTYSGSEQPDASERLGTINCLHPVLAPLLAELARGKGSKVSWPPFVAPTLGVEHLTIPGMLERLINELPAARLAPSVIAPGRVLDSGIEAQVHGPIDLKEDIERLVVDPAFRGTPTEKRLIELCQKYEIALDWHCGFRLAATDVPDDFRGPAVSKLALRIASEGFIDAAVIGAAQQSLTLYPEEWKDCGATEDTLQHLKQLWHILVYFGLPTASA